jgi:hypothetical protein
VATTYTPGQTLGRGDLDIFLTDNTGQPVNAADIYYALYYVDPGPPEVEVLIGSAHRIPLNPQIGEYYAALMVPPTATVGTYRVKWTFREFVSSAPIQVVQQFQVALPTQGNIIAVRYSQAQQQMIDKLRLLLRDQCAGGEEEVEIDVGGEQMTVRLEDLWEALKDEP